MEPLGKTSDCYFYFYSSCTKGDHCPYRHCKEALGTERVCTLWKEGRCVRSNCKFRHMESRIDRRNIPCYWEDQPGGCKKPHCVFLHKRPKGMSLFDASKKLILPISAAPITSHNLNVTVNTKVEKNDISLNGAGVPVQEVNVNVSSPLAPFVVSFDENEESDTESPSSTPVKSNENQLRKTSIRGTNLISKFSDKKPFDARLKLLSGKSTEKPLNFEIKSLEQIRLEKIHKESDIYKTDYEVPTLEDYNKQRVIDVDQIYPIDVDQVYPPTSDFINITSENPSGAVFNFQSNEVVKLSLKKSPTQVINKVITFKSQTDSDNDAVFKIQSKEVVRVSSKKNPTEVTNKIITFKKQTDSDNDSLGFKVKTLDEIRREKSRKATTPPLENGAAKTVNRISIKRKSPTSINETSSESLRKLKICRKLDAKISEPKTNGTQAKRKNSALNDGRQSKSVKLEASEEKPQSASPLRYENRTREECLFDLEFQTEMTVKCKRSDTASAPAHPPSSPDSTNSTDYDIKLDIKQPKLETATDEEHNSDAKDPTLNIAAKEDLDSVDHEPELEMDTKDTQDSVQEPELEIVTKDTQDSVQEPELEIVTEETCDSDKECVPTISILKTCPAPLKSAVVSNPVERHNSMYEIDNFLNDDDDVKVSISDDDDDSGDDILLEINKFLES